MIPEKIKWLLLIRVFVATFLLAVAALAELQVSGTSHGAIYYVFGVVCLTSIMAALVDRRFAWGARLIPPLGFVDILLVTLLVGYTGGIASDYSIIYALIVIYVFLLGDKRGGYLAAGLSSIGFGVVIWMSQIGPVSGETRLGAISLDSHAVARISIQAALLLLIALLTSFVADREKRLRRQLVEREDEFKRLDILHRQIVESVDTGIFTFDNAGRIKTFNRSACEITGWQERNVLGKWVLELFPSIAATWIDEQSGRTTGRERFEMEVSIREGKTATLGYSLSPLLDKEGKPIGQIVIFQDITRIKAMEEQIERGRKMALIGEMAAGLAHEMRNPLAAIGGSIQVLRQGITLSESDERLMQIILRGKEQLEVFLRDFLMLARPARGEREAIDLEALIREVLESVRYGQDWHDGIRLVFNWNEVSGNAISGNRSEVRQVLLNVINNALQAMQDGGLLSIEQKIEVIEGISMLRMAVRDTGCGIEAEKLGKIFEPFYTTKDRGTGLGLAIVSRVMESHGGRVMVRSLAGEGTTVTLLLPVALEG